MLAVLAAIALSSAPGALAAETGLTGTVTNTSITPIAGIEVCAFSPSAEGFGCATTEASGKYTITGLVSGTYEVEFSSPFNSKLNYITQYYNGKSSFFEATPVPVNAGEITPNIDAELKEGGRITGTVTNTSSLAPIEGIEVCASSESPEVFRCAKTSSSGEYTIVGLATGTTYKVEFFSPFASPLNYLTQFFNGKSSSSEANTVQVTTGSTASGINAALKEGGRIAGRVTDASTGTGLKGVLVCATPAAISESSACAATSESGEYTISVLAAGSYTVVFDAGKNYITQYYSGKSSSSEANTVTVTAASTTPGIDAAMQTAGTPPVNTTPPALSGIPAAGNALMCTPGLWTGKPTPAFTYQWLRDGAPIAGANATSYAVQSADAGHSLSCQVTAKNTKGERSATSASLAIPALPPTPAPKPVVTITAIIKAHRANSPALIHIKCSGAASCRGSAELTMQVVTKHRKGKKTLVLAKGSYSLAAGKSGTIVLRLTAAGKKRLAHARHHPVATKLILFVQGGITITKSVRLR